MRIYIILLMFCSVILLNSCATILSGRKQEVSISIPTNKTKLTIDSIYIAEGTTFKPKIVKDLYFKQLKFEKEGYKTNYEVIVPDYRSNWTILSWIPFGALFFLPPLYDLGPNTWVYDNSHTAKPLRKYTYSDSTKKRLHINNIAVEVNNKNNIFEIYRYSDYIDNSEPTRTIKKDSLGLPSTSLETGAYEVLKKLNYIDTMNTVIADNVNTLTLNAKISKIVTKDVNYSSFMLWTTKDYRTFYESEITTEWTLENRYGDTLHKATVSSRSGQYNVVNDNLSRAQQNAISDALEISMLEFIDIVTKNDFLKVESVAVTFKDQIKISKPAKSPSNLEEAMKASVTIKRKEGGHGSGFFISNDGYIITNYHVISKNSEYTVIMNDGTELKAKIVRSNKATDLALLKVDGNSEFAYNIPDKQNYSVGDEVLAIGTPRSLQLGQSVSKGIVSGTRKYSGMTYVQTDISVNGGNSGGPILLKSGELISIVKYRIVERGTEGLSFSIPAYEALQNLGLSY